MKINDIHALEEEIMIVKEKIDEIDAKKRAIVERLEAITDI